MATHSVIVAMDHNRVIGCNNGLPWSLPADLRHFREKTRGKPVIMGRKTWESLLVQPLPGRRNIVISRNRDYLAPGAEVVHSVADALQCADEADDTDEVMFIGGASLYRQVLPAAQRLYITQVDGKFEGDAWFPEFSADDWQLVDSERHCADDHHAYGWAFTSYTRR